MVSDPDDYLYVTGANVDAAHPHGDMDRVAFDGEVMPLRTGDTENFDAAGDPIPKKNILRGEDPCFLAEAAAERVLAHVGDLDLSYNVDTSSWVRNASGQFVFRQRLDGRFLYAVSDACYYVDNRDDWLDGDGSDDATAHLPQGGNYKVVYPGSDTVPNDGRATIAAAFPGSAFGTAWASGTPVRERQGYRPVPGGALDIGAPLTCAPLESMFENLKMTNQYARECQLHADNATPFVLTATGHSGWDDPDTSSDAQRKYVRYEVSQGRSYRDQSDPNSWGAWRSSVMRPTSATASDLYFQSLRTVGGQATRLSLPPGTKYSVLAVFKGHAQVTGRASDQDRVQYLKGPQDFVVVVALRDVAVADGEGQVVVAAGDCIAALELLEERVLKAGEWAAVAKSAPGEDPHAPGYYTGSTSLDMYMSLSSFWVVARLGDRTKWWA